MEGGRERIHGIIHCTGGGQAKCRDFGNGVRYVKDNLFELPPLFAAIYESGEIPMKEMFQVFNCGHRIEFYVDEKEAQGIMDIASSFNIDSRIVGHVEKSSNGNTNEVIIKSHGEEFVYN